MSEFKIVCFIKEEPTILFPLLLPFRFQWSDKQTLTWQDEFCHFRIVPFSSVGRESMGYRVVFTGSVESCQYLFDQSLSRFSPSISGIEWTHQTGLTQSQLVNRAEKAGYTRGSLLGLYEHKGIGIVLLPNGDINIQIRNRHIQAKNLYKLMGDMETAAAPFLPKPFDLFNLDGVRDEVYVS
ncbi:MAG: hypothetical protein R3267_11870 [Paenisporosarcina sp.]|nr:hypothetical protein [Paenisporosarcina sp.]